MRDGGSQAALVLPDGRTIDYAIRRSSRASSLRLQLSAREGLVVIAPEGLDRRKLLAMVARKSEWIQERLASFDAVRHLIATAPATRPQAFDLAALGESWRVEYKPTRGRTVGARVDRPGRLVVSGAVDEFDRCHAALRRWLARHAVASLPAWVEGPAKVEGLKYDDVTIKNQRTRWGSCSNAGRISLNCKLLFLPPELVRYVIWHELCHLLEPNHSERFWMHLRRFEPRSDALHGRMRDAWKYVPTWAQRGVGLLL
jgi:predicted metal-dependent hydrolase